MPFKIYRSSAGSGKTFTLVKEYLRIALSTDRSDNYRGILAVTFTNKAAEEMKVRVIRALQNISAGNEQDTITQLLSEELAISVETIAQRAKQTLKHMLHHYADLSISTIDRFSHRIIRTFAQDLGLSVNFEVELDTDVLKQAVFENLMSKVGTEKLLTDVLVDFIRSAADDEKGWNIDGVIKEYIGVLFSEESRFHLEKLRNIGLDEFHALRKSVRPKIVSEKHSLVNLAREILKQAEGSGLTTSSFSYGKSGIFSYIQKIASSNLEIPRKRALDTVANDKFYGSKISETERVSIDLLKPNITDLVNHCEQRIPRINYYEIVFNRIYAVALLDEMHRILQEVQHEEEILHIGEFNHLISDVVMTESAPFIYERIGARYHHFLVDEFQDTSILQWFNLLPLVDESLAHDNLCLVVGDAKQSIYRWRGGDVQQFVKLPQIHRPPHLEEKLDGDPQMAQLFAQREKSLDAALSSMSLDSNFRSSPTVVNFNNSLFEELQKDMPAELATMFDKAAQIPKKATDGLVNVHMIRDAKDLTSADYEELVFEQIRTWVDECLADGFSAGDISIIFRTNKQAIKTALDLVEHGYDVVSNESLLINNSPRVQLLVNVAKFLDDPSNAVNIAELLHNLSICDETQNFAAELQQTKGGRKTEFIGQLLLEQFPDIDWQRLNFETPYQLFSVLSHGVFPNVREPNLTFFLDEVLSFNQKKNSSLSDFLEHWKEKREKLSIALDESPNSIRILTIHKSKGLEYPVVIHPFADYPDNRRNSSASWVYLQDDVFTPLDRLRLPMSKSLENTPFEADLELEKARAAMDTYNEMYVALTRAKQRLYVSGKLATEAKKDREPSSAIQFIRKYLLDAGKMTESELQFQVGERTKQELQAAEFDHLQLQSLGDPNWRERLKIARPIADAETRLSELDARQLGIAVHEAMANIFTANDVESAVRKLVENGSISNSDSQRIAEHIRNLIGKSELAPLYTAEKSVRNEADIQLSSGEWLRPDRVVTEHGKAWVIDYKTGEERNEHQRQLSEYVNAVSELGFEPVKGMLVYIESEKLVKI